MDHGLNQQVRNQHVLYSSTMGPILMKGRLCLRPRTIYSNKQSATLGVWMKPLLLPLPCSVNSTLFKANLGMPFCRSSSPFYKERHTYETLLRVLEEPDSDPSRIMTDFERCVELAKGSEFGAHAQIQFCFYHLAQSIWRKVQNLDVQALYERDSEFRLFYGQIDALAFLPLDEVNDGEQHLRELVPEEVEPLLEYFENTYVTGQLRPRRGDGLRLSFRRVPLMFEPAKWNMHELLSFG